MLAFTDTLYDIHFDCLAYLSHRRDTLSWLSEIDEAAPGLAEILPQRDSAGWFDYINEGRIEGKRYLSIAIGLSEEQVQKIKALPMFNLPTYQGGLIIESRYRRNYPFGSLARRTIGYYKNDTLRYGMERHFDYLLSGRDGGKTVRYGRYEGRDIQGVFTSIDGPAAQYAALFIQSHTLQNISPSPLYVCACCLQGYARVVLPRRCVRK